MAHHHAEHYAKVLATLPDVELVGFSDDDPVRSCRVAEETGLHQFSTLDELLSQDLDLAVVCSENSRHRKDVTLAAHRGVSVLVEKPLATSAQDARALILACREAGVNLRTAFPMRFSYPLVSLAGLVRTGRLGRPLVVVSANQGQVPDAIRPWFTVADLAGGGALTDHTVHLLDYCRWLLDDEVATVYAQVAGSVGSGAPVERFALVALRFTGGTIVTIDASWSRPVSFPSWGGLRLTVSGTAGRADADAFGEHLSVQRSHGHLLARLGC